MPKRVERAADPEAVYSLHVEVPGWLKNRLIELAEVSGVSYRAYVLTCLYRMVEEDRGVPVPPPARVPLPSTVDQVRAWAVGDGLLLPCGGVGSCVGVEGEPVWLGEVGFCVGCGVRVV